MMNVIRSKHYTCLDGLRGIAVLLILAFHLEIPNFQFGYLGVDVFFIISGFIVTKVTLRRINSSIQFDWKDFFFRRIKRLWPELYLVMSATLITGLVLLYRPQFLRIPISGLAQTVFGSNVRFWLEAEDYFNIGAKAKPLLHTWSLSVEEQFYVIFAAVACLGIPRSKISMLGLVLLFLGSLISSILLSSEHNAAVFYLLPFRAWEFLAGVIPALIEDPFMTIDKSLKNALIWIALIVLGIITYYIKPTKEIASSKLTILMISMAFFIWLLSSLEDSNESTSVGRCLAFPPLTFIGTISYSLYLWHWPIICFTSHIYDNALSDPIIVIGCVCVIFLLSIISHYGLTTPIRSIPKCHPIFVTLPVICFIVFAMFSTELAYDIDSIGTSIITGGNSSENASFDVRLLGRWMRRTGCSQWNCYEIPLNNCDKDPERETVVVLGDSQAVTLGLLFEKFQEKHNLCFHLYASDGCGPYFQKSYHEGFRKAIVRKCMALSEAALKFTKTQLKPVKYLFLISRWKVYLDRIISDQSPEDLTLTSQKTNGSLNDDGVKTVFQSKINATLAQFNGLVETIVIMFQIPEPIKHLLPPICKINCDRFAFPRLDTNRTRGLLRELAAAYRNIKFLDPVPVFCDEILCHPYTEEGIGMYADTSHLNQFGSLKLTTLFNQLLAQNGET